MLRAAKAQGALINCKPLINCFIRGRIAKFKIKAEIVTTSKISASRCLNFSPEQ